MMDFVFSVVFFIKDRSKYGVLVNTLLKNG